MINFEPYLGKAVVLITKEVDSPDDISGIRIDTSTVFKFKNKWVLARPLTAEDLQDEDFIGHLNSIWKHDEDLLKSFLRHKKEYGKTT